jgi:hypothetical protein
MAANPDYYAMAAEVADALRLAGQGDFGDSLDDVVAAGFSSTEILMAIRHTLELQMRDPRWPATVRPQANELLKAVERAL